MANKVLKISTIILCFVFTSCLREDDLKLPFKTNVPINLNDGWELSSPSEQGINEAELRKIYEYYHESKDLWQVRSLLVFRNNKLIAESYTKNPNDITEPTPIWSCTKQVTCILLGIAVEQGLVDNINDPIQKYLPDEISKHPDKASITIQNLLKMKSGIEFSNDGFNGGSSKFQREVPDNSVDFVLGLPVYCPQGEQYHYNDGDPHIISAILQKQTGKTSKVWAEDVLFSRLGMENYDWAVYKDGVTMGAFGISTTPREMARIGHLVMNKGNWKGEQIVNSAWLEDITSTKVPVEEVNTFGKSFGYFWWIDEGREIYFMAGQGGQFVFIKPSKNLVMVTTADATTGNVFEMDAALDIFDRIDNITN